MDGVGEAKNGGGILSVGALEGLRSVLLWGFICIVELYG